MRQRDDGRALGRSITHPHPLLGESCAFHVEVGLQMMRAKGREERLRPGERWLSFTSIGRQSEKRLVVGRNMCGEGEYTYLPVFGSCGRIVLPSYGKEEIAQTLAGTTTL